MQLFNFDRMGCSDIIYDGVHLSDIFEIRDIKMNLLPSITANMQDIGNRPGTYYVSRKVETRSIKLTLGLDAGSRCPVDVFYALLNQENVIAKTEPKKMQFKDDRYFLAMLVGETPIEQKGTKGIIECEFVCYDPFLYGKEHTLEISTGDNAFTVKGSQPVWPVFDLMGCDTTFTLTDKSTGDMVRVPNLTPSLKLTIEMEMCRCTENGHYKPSDITVTDFWPLPAGDVTLNLSSGSGHLSYRERYL